MAKELGMASERGSGEAAERASRNRWQALLAVSMVFGGASAMAVISVTHNEGGLFDADLPAGLALSLAAGWLVLIGSATWYHQKNADELELAANYYGYAIGGGLVLTLYPVWYLCWWAGLVMEPSHEALVGLLFGGAMAGYLWKKFR